MRLLRLELLGFKSFAKKTVIEVDEGITAIVGPNGSGKSNIADAIRWVLGEQSAKALRGSKMEDVIFNGTQHRKPLGYCEVTLVFENTDGKLRIDYTEVSITRRVYRSGEGEYLINNRQCRLKDISELFRDTGIGKEGYSIIGQGRVDEILSNRSQERRTIFEEAAGVMRYRVRKEESERKLDNTNKNLIRITDILSELEARLSPLKEQSESARAYLALRDELKAAELNLFLVQYDTLNERINAAKMVLSQLNDELMSAQEHEKQLASECTQLEENERFENTAISELKNQLLRLTAELEGSLSESKVLDERIANAMRELDRVDDELNTGEESKSGLFKAIALANDDVRQQSAAIEELAKKIDVDESNYKSKTEELLERETALEEQKNMMMEALRQLSGTMSDVSRLNATAEALEARSSEATSKRNERIIELDTLEAECKEASEKHRELVEEKAALIAERQKLIAQQKEATRLLNDERSVMATMEREMQNLSSRARVLIELKESHDGYYDSVKNILRDAKSDEKLSTAIEGVVAELISVPNKFETALEMSLGAALQNIVTPNEYCAKQVIERARNKRYGRITLLPLTVIRGRTLTSLERRFIDVEGCYGVASDLIQFDERYRGIIENLLGRTVIVRDLDVGIEINKQAKAAFRIATIGGDIINAGGSMTGGSVQRREFSILGREREIEELKEKIRQIELALAKRRELFADSFSSYQELESLVESLSERIHGAETSIASQSEKVDIVNKIRIDTKKQLEAIESELERISDSIVEVRGQLTSIEQTKSGMEQGNETSREDIAKKQRELAIERKACESFGAELTKSKIGLTALMRDRHAKQNEIKRLEGELVNSEDRYSIAKKRKQELNATVQECERARHTAIDKTASYKRSCDELTEKIGVSEGKLLTLIETLNEVRNKRAGALDQMAILRERKQKAEVGQTKAEVELTAIYDRIWNEYQLTYEGIKQFKRDVSAAAERVKCDELKRQIKALGVINIAAMEEYALVKDRYDTMFAQAEDLRKAQLDLQRVITELTSTMKEEFKRQFEMIRINFRSVFAELFHGGHAEIRLTDNNDVLNCDIEIVAQPPGKKLQLLSLLSGGERALTAIALLFAILALKPVSFCVLDEIETSLDEANVSNFAEYLKNYSKNTQFIMITHRKGSMAVSNAMYGIAMEEKGISKVVSARFDEENVV